MILDECIKFSLKFSLRVLFRAKDLNKYVDFGVLIEISGGTKMATLTLSVPGYEEAKKKFPEVNWNEVLKVRLLRRLEELKQFEALKNEGLLGSKKMEQFLRKNKRGKL